LETKLVDRVAIITGAGRGLGRAIALEFARSGASLALIDLDINTLSVVEDEAAKIGVETLTHQGDVSKKAEVDKAVDLVVRRFSRVDILVNNAGTIVRKPMEQYVEEDWDRVINVNLKGTFNFCHAVAKPMISQQYGRIINISSIMGERALPPRASYCASKGGIIALTRDLACEWARHSITVNAISPGWVETELTKNYFAQEEVRSALLQRIPIGRFGRPEEIAQAAVFLASDKSSYITGQSFCVDGGWTAL
jgi:NAD(P)-dependent dehydrogenase (short-subunit alcohol dehydrogenase family)